MMCFLVEVASLYLFVIPSKNKFAIVLKKNRQDR